jgi:hypothetical protein
MAGPVRLEKNSFVAGEVSPRMYGRTDIAQYGQGCRRLENCFVLPHGGIMGRPGTRYVNTVKYPGRRTRLLTFQVSTEASYVIEAGDNYFRFYVNGGLLVDGGGSAVEVSTPYDQNDVFLIQTAQEADVMYIAHPNKPVYKLSRTSVTSFSLDEVTWNKGRAPTGPLNTNPDNYITTNVAGTTYDRRITMTEDTFTSDDVGRHFLLWVTGSPGKVAYWKIQQYVSPTVVEVDNLYEFSGGWTYSGSLAWEWAFGLIDDANGCTAISFHQGRLALGGFSRQPDWMVFSVSDDFENFELQSTDQDLIDEDSADKGIQRRTVDNQVNAVRWLREVEGLLIAGTSGAEFQVRGSNEDSLTPVGTIIRRVTRRGSTQLPGVVVDNKIFFIERSNAVLRRFGYGGEGRSTSLSSVNHSVLSEHLLKDGGGATDLAYSQFPISTLWIPMVDGTVVSWSHEQEQDVSGPARHILGGDFLGKAPLVESVAVSQNSVPLNQKSAQTGYVGNATSSMTNPSFETGTLTGWTTADSTFSAVASAGAISAPKDGSYFLYRDTSATAEATIHNTIDLTTLAGWNNVLVDDGSTTIDASAWLADNGGTAEHRFRIIALDALGNELANLFLLD